MHTTVLHSGGLDSTVLLALAVHQDGPECVLAVSVNYAQRHGCELNASRRICDLMGVERVELDLSGWGCQMRGSSQTDPQVPVPEGHYEDPTMRVTVVPHRNAVLLTAAAGVAASRGCHRLMYAAHAGDHAVYPDCRPEFAEAMRKLLLVSDYGRLDLQTPFVGVDKAEVVRQGQKLAAPLGETWSCYKGGVKHCGKCGTCVERREAFAKAQVPDPTEYES